MYYLSDFMKNFIQKIKISVDIALNKEVLSRAIKVAVVVGILLNLINQGEHIISLSFGSLHKIKFLLTFFVPYLVSTYTAVSFYIKFKPGTISKASLKLKCKNCNETKIDVENSVSIPECKNCGTDTDWIPV